MQKQKGVRLRKKVDHLQTVIESLQDGNLISANCSEVLQAIFSGVPSELMQRMLNCKTSRGKGRAYCDELQAFAMTLQFYSAKAYDFVRETFDLTLPHPRSLRTWYSHINGEPGFTKCAFDAISAQVLTDTANGRATICSLMLDEMAIRKHIEYTNGQFHGYVDIGNGQIDDSTPVAKDALVIMVVAVNTSWKVPVGYFLVDGMSGVERANLVNEALQRLHTTGATIISLTCDGPACHFAMMRALGADLTVATMQPFFEHPADNTKRVHVLLDACHMLKLVRNTFADQRVLMDADGNVINWGYVVSLDDLQRKEGLRLGTKVRKAHMEWQKQKMKVNLAAQVISSSVADAIAYCDSGLHLPEFAGCEGTVRFLPMFDQIFDLLNSRNPLGKGSKAPMSRANAERWAQTVNDAESYIVGLKDNKGVLLTQVKRKTAFVGFLVCVRSARNIFGELVGRPDAPMRYLLTYKLSQDHIELFFSAVRARGGFNNNPTSMQFQAAYKRLLMRHSIKATGNCITRDETRILDILRDSSSETDAVVSCSAVNLARRYDMLDMPACAAVAEHSYSDMPHVVHHSEYKEAAVAYIAGYVVNMAKKRVGCERCQEALVAENAERHNFVVFKSRGGLQQPSPSVVAICLEAEKSVQFMLRSSGGVLPQCAGILPAIASAVLANTLGKPLFPTLDIHMFDTSVEDNHVHTLVKTVAECFARVRLHHLGKCETEKAVGTNVRKKLTKLILFKHQ